MLRRGRVVRLRINWDHFVPYAYAMRNRRSNWVAACHVCNGIKAGHIFSTVAQAQTFIRAEWLRKGYRPNVRWPEGG